MEKGSIAPKNDTIMAESFDDWAIAFLSDKQHSVEEIDLYRQCYYMSYVAGMERVVEALCKLGMKDK